MGLLYQQAKDFTRGITDDRFLGQGYVSDAEGVNIRQESRGVVLSNNYRDIPTYGTFTGTDFIYEFLVGVNPGGGGALRDYAIRSGGVVDLTNGNTGLSSVAAFRNAGYIKSGTTTYGFIVATNTTVYRWDNGSTGIGTASTAGITLSSSSDYRPILIDGSFLYIGGDRKVDCIDCSTGTWVIFKTLSMTGVCRGITKIGDQIFVYTNDGLDGYKCVWDGVSAFPLYIQKRADNPVINVVNMGNIDYVITGAGSLDVTQKYRRLWLSQGYDKQLLYGSDFIVNQKELFNFNPIETNSIRVYGNNIFFPGSGNIYTYGKNKASLPMSLTKDISIDDNILRITAIKILANNSMYIGYVTNTGVVKYRVQDMRVGYAYGTQGHITTLAFDGGDIETEKMNNRIVVNYNLCEGTSIDIYTRIDGYKYWVFDCSGITMTPIVGDTYTYGGLTYTVVEYTANNELICTRNEISTQYNSILYSSGSLVKTFGVGDASVTFSNVDNFVFIASITDKTKNKTTIQWKKGWYDLEIKAILYSNNKNITPKLNSIKTLFGYNNQDVG